MKKENYKLKRIRKEKKLTTKDMANLIGFSQGYYVMLENGNRRLYYDTAKKIASVFNLKPDDLFYPED